MTEFMSGNEIRKKFLEFFRDKHEHYVEKSSSLVPDNPTVLLTTAGMLQFVPYYLGLEQPKYTRITTCQKCARAGGKDSDIENVGRTPRHHTFFEMLGNFAFGDYFKKEIIPWSWDFVTNYLKLDKNRLWITIYEDDDESFEIWNKEVGVAAERIIRKGKKDNFWGPPGATGSCGPCTEIHYDLGENLKCSDDCSIATCECDRWVEIWNLVFTNLFKDDEGNFSPLEKCNVDTGMGLERITMVVQGKTSTFETDLLKPILDKVCEITKVDYKKSEKTDISLRIITDHARCVTFMVNDGIRPANDGRGYVLRMILRRALRHGKILGLELPFLKEIVDVVIDLYKEIYPDLELNKAKIQEVILQEEERFKLTLDRGYKLLDELIEKKIDIDGENAFKLYDTFGFPLELTVEIAQEAGLKVDETGFKEEMAKQKERAKAAAQKISLTDDLAYVAIENKFGSTEFVGYDKLSCDAKVVDIVKNDEYQDIIDVILDKTPFYAECGGQVGDTGVIKSDKFEAEVINTFKVNKLFVHRVKVLSGEVVADDKVFAQVDEQRRHEITIHHSNAHLLQAALVKVLGDEVKQAGSQVEPNRTRFDFSFSRAMTSDEIVEVENIINGWISKNLERKTVEMDLEEAKQTGATALFGEKYEDKVRVVSIGNISKEFCAGCHVNSTIELKLTKIVSESAIAAGSRRIEAVCGDSAIQFLNNKANIVDTLSKDYKIPQDELISRIDKMNSENIALSKEIEALKEEKARSRFATFISRAKDINGGKLFISKIEQFPAKQLKVGIEALADKLGEAIIVLINENESNLSLVSYVTKSFNEKGIKAGDIVRELATKLNGKGGGNPQFAQGGAPLSDDVDAVLAEIEDKFLKL